MKLYICINASYRRKSAVKWSNATLNAQMSISFFHIFVTEPQCEPETCIRAISDKWDLNVLSLRVLKYLWVSFLHPGVRGQTLDGVSFRAAECTLDHGEAVGMDHPAVPSQIWLTKEQVFTRAAKKCAIGTCRYVPVMKISEAVEQHCRLVLLPPSGDAR